MWGQQDGSEIPSRPPPRAACCGIGFGSLRMLPTLFLYSLQPWSCLLFPPLISLVLEQPVAKCGKAVERAPVCPLFTLDLVSGRTSSRLPSGLLLAIKTSRRIENSQTEMRNRTVEMRLHAQHSHSHTSAPTNT